MGRGRGTREGNLADEQWQLVWVTWLRYQGEAREPPPRQRGWEPFCPILQALLLVSPPLPGNSCSTNVRCARRPGRLQPLWT